MPHDEPRDRPFRQALERAIEPYLRDGPAGSDGVPGVVAIAGTSGDDSGVVALGARSEAGDATDVVTRYDLASLTKVVATLPAVLALVGDGVVDLDAPLKNHLPNAGWFRSPSLGDRSVRDLLSHTSGLPAWAPFIGIASARRTVTGHALASDLPHDRGHVVYSDLGFIVLGALVEAITGVRLDAYVEERVFGPLGIAEEAGFRPLDASNADVPIAPTERCGWRGRLLVGEVHDEAAWIMDGVAGHAGAFATAGALARYARAWLRFDPVLGDPDLLRAAVARATDDGQPARGLGWVLAPDGAEPASEPESVEWRAGRGFGHTGFTGTSLWIDPERDRFCVLLSNRVHPTRHGGQAVAALRRAVHAAVFDPPEGADRGPADGSGRPGAEGVADGPSGATEPPRGGNA